MSAVRELKGVAAAQKSRGNRKYLFVGLTCAVVVAVVVAGSLVAIKFFLDSTSDLVEVREFRSVSYCDITVSHGTAAVHA